MTLDIERVLVKSRHIFVIGIVLLCFIWMIVPMVILRGDYCYTIHDGLDSYAGIVQYIHDNHLYFHLNQNLPIMNGMEGKYTFIGFTLYDFYNCVFGYINGQILTRITACVVGFFSFVHLAQYLYSERSFYFNDMVLLIAALYIVIPVSPIRVIGLASLPIVVETFLRLRNRERISKVCLIGIIFPILSVFDAIFLFVLGFWFLFMIFDAIKAKRVNKNLVLTFVFMCLFTVLVNYNFFLVAMTAGDTSREIYVYSTSKPAFNISWFRKYLLEGQYHATAFPQRYLWPICFAMTLVFIGMTFESKSLVKSEKTSITVLVIGWAIVFIGPLIMTAQESGFRVGILLIDGFQWGRVIALTTFMWPMMLMALSNIFSDRKLIRIVIGFIICLQLTYVARVDSIYNDTWDTIQNEISFIRNDYKPFISYNEFSSRELFESIKNDIEYNGEGVAAYGYHPAVLLINDFNTVDGYFTVHSMRWQNEFREIIEPALNEREDYKSYYDNWGGRMYLFGPIDYSPTKDKYREETEIYINVSAYKKYGGRYILSAAELSNASEQGLRLINDYDSGESLYHIWLYEVI